MSRYLGQAQAISVLSDAYASGRVAHAWIFHGPQGVGKRTCAELFAAALLHEGEARPGTGRTARDLTGWWGSDAHQIVAAGKAAGFHLIRKELAKFSDDADIRARKQTTIPIDVLREFLIEPAARSAARRDGGESSQAGTQKVFVVDEAELLADPAQNVLLKTLEEPARGMVVILITAAEDRLLPTIRSRCQRVAFTALSDPEMAEWLEDRHPGVNAAQRRWLLHFAEGSPGQAQAAVEYDLHSWHSQIGPMVDSIAGGRFPAGAGNALEALVKEFADARVAALGEAGSKEAANKLGARYLFQVLGCEIRTQMRAAVKDRRRPELERALGFLDCVRAAESAIARNVNLGLVMSDLVITMSEAQRLAVEGQQMARSAPSKS